MQGIPAPSPELPASNIAWVGFDRVTALDRLTTDEFDELVRPEEMTGPNRH